MWYLRAKCGPDGEFNEDKHLGKDPDFDIKKGDFNVRIGDHTATLNDENVRRCKFKCGAKLLPGETETLCCANGRIVTQGKYWQMKARSSVDPEIQELFQRETEESKAFMKNIEKRGQSSMQH